MSDQNRHSFALAIAPPPADGDGALAASASALDPTAEGTLESTGTTLQLTLSVEVLGQDVIRISAVDGQGRSYEGKLSLSPTASTELCYVCDANGCRWVSPCS